MWSGNAIDIANTLKKSCKAVLRGGSGIDPIPKGTSRKGTCQHEKSDNATIYVLGAQTELLQHAAT